ncbi:MULTISPECIES: DUF6766 family protein [unclassified Microcoleus]|uniref:DUF6766 family protein n=1 Tax=unclassified Microcoleus TaxID=2642155 RepID=UPI002FD3A39C
MGGFFRENSLSLLMFRLLFFSLVGQIITGYHDYSQELKDRQQHQICVVEYLGSGQFIEALFENWESEFLSNVTLTVLSLFLRQKGSPESKPVVKRSYPEGNRPKDPTGKD